MNAVEQTFDQPWRVHVLCAQWCGVCRDYRAFVEASHAGSARWVWVDIENHSDTLGELEVENFPTLLVTEGEQVRFLGTITPQPEVAERLVASLLTGSTYRVPVVSGMEGIVRALCAL